MTEDPGAGTSDAIFTTASYTLPSNVENMLLLEGSGNINGTGNSAANLIGGNSANNIIDGNAGADVLIGQDGDDTYFVDTAGDLVIEAASAGTDIVNTFASYVLAANVENLTMIEGAGSLQAGGNPLSNALTGNSSDNVLDGAGGGDALVGGGGNDTFISTAGEANGDIILDFNGNGAGVGDKLFFNGYGTAAQGATFVQLDATRWHLNSADGTIHDVITFSNSASVHSNDFTFFS